MEAIVERACGLDVHQSVIVACVLVGAANERPRKEVRSFRTVTRELLELKDWLEQLGCTHVGMESTGVYWKPVHALLEEQFCVIVGNAHHIKTVPGRKTDVKDAEWIADLIRHGLIRASFVPPKDIRVLRELTRYRRKLVQTRATERNRLIKLLETANVKLASFLTDVFGVSGMAMLRALLRGELQPSEMAKLAKGRLRSKVADIELALEAELAPHQRFILQTQLDRLEQADAQVQSLDERIEEQLAPYREEVALLQQIHGLSRVVVPEVIAEIGVDMTAFQSDSHLSSWGGVCPGNHESAGKRKRGTKRSGNVHLTTALVEAAQGAVRKKDSYLKDKFHRLKARRGYKRALMAVAHKILIAVYHVLRDRKPYHDLGDSFLDRNAKRRATSSLVRRLENLGYSVELRSTA